MVAVAVRKQNGVEVADAFAEHLLPKIGTCIDNEALAIDLDVHGRPQAFVAIVEGATYVARAPDHGHAL